MDSNNVTEYGGAVYVKDSDPISYCFSDIANLEKCLFQVDGSVKSVLTLLKSIIQTSSHPMNPTF